MGNNAWLLKIGASFMRSSDAVRLCAHIVNFAAILVGARGALAQTSRPTPSPAPLTFNITYDSSITGSFTGRVYVMFSSSGMGEPRFGPSWFGDDPFFAVDVRNWQSNTPLVVDDKSVGFPAPLSEVPQREWRIQAVMRINKDSPSIGRGPGSGYSAIVKRTLSGTDGGVIDLRIAKVVEPREFKQTDRIKLVEVPSALLSEFHKRPMNLRAAVILPRSYDDHPDLYYPALYWIGGFGSDHTSAGYMIRLWNETGSSDRIIRIVLDPSCYGGHHAFADSDNNGPVGRALVQELIPHVERTYRLVASPSARFLSGHSSGGWSSLWLQITYPDIFGGTWSIAPDPVDFRDFQRINLYESGANMYADHAGDRRPLARHGHDQVLIWYDDFARMEIPYGDGGQLRSFEWVFSPRGPDGWPQPLYNRATGEVYSSVAEHWRRYDIRLILEDRWDTLGPKLAGKIHVFMGEQDTFFLEGATKLLKESQERMGGDAVIEITAGKDHTSIATPGLRKRIDDELLSVFYEHHPQHRIPDAPAIDDKQPR
jgi:hypothetical protein